MTAMIPVTMARAILASCLALALSSAAAAQQNPPPPKPAPEQPPPPARPEPAGQPINIRVEVAITDQSGTGEPMKKTVTMVAAERSRSSIRYVADRGFLNVDAQPTVIPGGSIRMILSIEYMPSIATGAEPARTLSRLNEQITVMLEAGRPLVLSQAPDPSSERKVTIQVTATVMK
jgi:hypothetical protein